MRHLKIIHLKTKWMKIFRGWQLTISSTFPSPFRKREWVCGWRYLWTFFCEWKVLIIVTVTLKFYMCLQCEWEMETKHFHVRDMNDGRMHEWIIIIIATMVTFTDEIMHEFKQKSFKKRRNRVENLRITFHLH